MKEKVCNECKKSFIPYHKNTQKWCDACKKKGDWFLKRFNIKKRMTSLCYCAKNRATSKGLPFDITNEYVLKLFEDQKGKCVISGRTFNLDSYGNKGQVNPDAPSLDRVIPSLGYVKGNVRLVTYLTNVCLNEYGHDFLLDLCEDLLIHAGNIVERSGR